MNLFLQMLNLQLAMLILIIVGIIAKKSKIVNTQTQKGLSDLLIYFILPCNIIVSFQGELPPGLIKNSFVALGVSLTIQVFSIFWGKFIFSRFSDEMKPVMNYGLICSNSTFIGLPVVNNIYDSIGVLYASIFQIPIRITMWTSGLTLFTGSDIYDSGKRQPVFTKETIKRLIMHPCIIAVFLGLIVITFHVQFPNSIERSITFMSQSTIPVSMIVIGCMLSECKAKDLFDKATFYFAFIRLFAFPLLAFALLKILKMDPLITGVATLLTGMPAGSTTAILADKYDCNGAFGSRVLFVSTICSIFTIPVLCALF